MKHFNKTSIDEVFGKTEQALYDELINDDSTASYVSDAPVFYIDKDFNVYPNVAPPEPSWLLGNLKTDGAKNVLENYTERISAE